MTVAYCSQGEFSVAETVIGILASGRGSNAQAIVEAINSGRINARVAVLISDNKDAQALERAAANGIAACCIERQAFGNRSEFEAAITAVLQEHGVELVVLAGFMRLLSGAFITRFSGAIMNIHPSLLPSFPGLDAQEQAIKYGAKVSGCTVHFVDDGMDTGPVILQQAVSVLPDDTATTLAGRILTAEHELYPEAVRLYCEGRLRIDGRVVRIAPTKEGFE